MLLSYTTASHFRKILLANNFHDPSFLSYLFKNRVLIEKIQCFQACKAGTKVTAALEEDILSKLEINEMKHRKHPGIRKTQVYSLPENLLLAADKVLSKYDAQILTADVDKLNKALWHRSLPLESSELEMRTAIMMEKMNINLESKDENEYHHSMKKMAMVRKRMLHQLKRWQPIDYTEYMCVRYLAARLAQNYACISKVFSEIVAEVPTFNPKTFFDFGSGVGSTVWAAYDFWGSSLKEYFCIDASAEMITLAETLLQGGETNSPAFLKELHFRQFLPSSNIMKYDLVVSAFSMIDIPSMKERMKIIDILWKKTSDTLVIIENGGNTGYSIVLDARDYILKLSENSENKCEEAHVVAPCPHDMACPLFLTKKICHFPVSYHQFYPKKHCGEVKKTLMSYIVLRKGKKKETDKTSWPRIIENVLRRSKQAHCHLCSPDGKYHPIIFTKKKHGRHVYRCARQSSHGDLLPISLSEDILERSQEEQNESENNACVEEENKEM